MLSHGKKKNISLFGLKCYPGNLLSRAGEEQSTLAMSPSAQSRLQWRVRAGICSSRGQQMVTRILPVISSVTLSPSLLFCEPPHLSQLHPVAAVHVCLCSRSQGPQEAPWVGRDLSCCPSTVAGDTHSAICISEKQLRCILKTQGWNFLLPVVRW